jgi:amicyanin
MRRYLVGVVLAVAAPLSAQSLLYRSPNLGGTWVPDAGVVQFNFLHRFYVSPAASGHSVSNFPTFTLATGVVGRFGVGLRFATKSFLVGSGRGATSTNETEVFGRLRLLGGAEGTPGLHLAATPAYNFLAQSVEGELAADYGVGAITVEGAARIMNKPLGASSGTRTALAAGAVARINQYIAVSADVGSFVSPTVRAAWSAGLQVAIPGSPHTFAFEVSNGLSSTIQGASIGFSQRLYGFEFTIPIHLVRFGPWFHKSRTPAVSGDLNAAVAATVTIGAMKFHADTVVVGVGQAVRWNNTDPLGHTITFDGAEPGSALINPNGAYIHVFDKPGTYPYHCTPHPFMKGVVVVR